MSSAAADRPAPPAVGLLVHQGGGCLSPRVCDFLCFVETPRSVLGEDAEDELPFYVFSPQQLQQQADLQCPALWVDAAAVDAGVGMLQVLFRLGGPPHHCPLPLKPIKLQPVKQAAGDSAGRREAAGAPLPVACKAFVSGKVFTQLYRLVAGLFPKLQRMHHELCSEPGVQLAVPGQQQQQSASPEVVIATPSTQGMLLEGPPAADGGEPTRLRITVNFRHACLELTSASGTPTCLRTVNCLAEALTALRGEAGPSPTQLSPIKGPSGRLASPAKPPLRPASTLESLQLGVHLVQSCEGAKLREGVALLSTAASDAQLTAACLNLGAIEALVTAAATVLPSSMMGMTELLTSLVLGVTALLDAAPQGSYAAGKLVSILAAVLGQSCANPLLLCQLLLAVLQRPDVRAEAMRHSLASAIADLYARYTSGLEEAARELIPPQQERAEHCSDHSTTAPIRKLQLQAAAGFGSPLTGRQPSPGNGASHVARMIAAYNNLSDSGSDGSPASSASPSRASPARSPSALSGSGRFKVPRLQLPHDESPLNPVSGLTRSTRRAMSHTPGGRRSPTPTPWGSPTRQRGGSAPDLGELSAAAQMAVVAGAVGESLIAADLPSIIAHKRRLEVTASGATANGGAAVSGEEVPPELLEGPVLAPQPSGRKPLEAHKILITARSLKSVETGTSLVTDSEVEGGSAERLGRALVDVEALKCLLLQALLLALPVMGIAGYPALDPSPLLAAEVLALVGKPLSPQQEQLKQLALQTLQCLSQQPDRRAADAHTLAAAVGTKLCAALGGGVSEEASLETCQLLQLLTEHVAAAGSPSAAVAVMHHCLAGLQTLLGVLMASAGLEPSEWAASSWRMFHSLVSLLGPVCAAVQEPETGRTLLGLLLADRQTASLLANVADHLFLEAEGMRAASRGYAASTPALQRDLLRMLTGLAGLVGRQPPLPVGGGHGSDQAPDVSRAASRLSALSISSGVDEQSSARGDSPLAGPGNDLLLGPSMRRGLTRKHALQFFTFLVSPNSGLAQRLLDSDPAGAATPGSGATGLQRVSSAMPPSATHIRLRQGLLDLLKALFSAPDSPFIADKATSDYYVRLHFIQFLKLYHNPQRDHQALFLCRQHLEVLQVLAGRGAAHTRHRFQQLSVLDFLVRELSLEMETAHPGARRAAVSRAGSTTSIAHHHPRRTSSGSALGLDSPDGRASGASSPVPLLATQQTSELGVQQRGALPAGVPVLRLPLRDGSAAAQQNSPQQQPAGQLGLAVPRLNLGLAGSGLGGSGQHSPGDSGTPSPMSSARLGRPPLPPSARAGLGGTPRMTSRLGRVPSARSVDRTPTPTSMLGDSKGARPGSSAFTIMADGRVADGRPAVPRGGASQCLGSGGGSDFAPPPAGLTAPLGRAVPGLQLGGLSRAAPSGSDGQPSVPHSVADSEADSSDDEDERACGTVRGSGAPTPLQGMELPPGFAFSGDLEEDLERLEALEQGLDSDDELAHHLSHANGSGSESASPTIPALRSSPFHQPLVPPLFGSAGVPRLALPGKASLAPPEAQQPEPAAQQQQEQHPRPGGLPAVPRLALTAGMHSNLEQRTASAEMAVAAAEAAAAARRREAGHTGGFYLADLERSALGKGKMQAATIVHHRRGTSISDVCDLAAELIFAEERRRRLLYRDDSLHVAVLQLVFTLLFDPESGELDRAYCDPYPWERKLPNVPFVLHCHLNHEDNRGLLPRLLPRLAALGPPARRLLRTLCTLLFRPEWYAARWRLSGSAGAYATIYRCQLPAWAGEGIVVLKVVDTPRHVQDRCSQVDVQEEVAVLQAVAPSPAACQLHDYGVDPGADALVLVLKNYRCSLKQWRARQPASPAGQLRLYYAIFGQVLAAVADLQARGCVHFDLKCDNVLLEPLGAAAAEGRPGTARSAGVSAAEFWAPSSERPPFRVVLGDFGESRLFAGGLDGAATTRARGTDVFKSPEMLLMGGGAAARVDGCTYDRRRRTGAGPASDVWSLGCLLYELVTGRLLFADADWLQLVARVTSPSMPLITEERAAEVAGLPGVLDLLGYMLVRDARMRPTLQDVQARLHSIVHSSRLRLPPHQPSSAALMSARSDDACRSAPSPLHSLPELPPGAREPLPLQAPLHLLPGLVLAPTAALQSAAAVRGQLTTRVVLLVSPASPAQSTSAAVAGPLAAISNMVQQPLAMALLVPAMAATHAGSRDSSPQPSVRYGPSAAAASTGAGPVFSAAHNPLFSPSLQSTAGSVGRGTASARTLGTTGATPRRALRLSHAMVHPAEEGENDGDAQSSARSARQWPTLHSGRVHPTPRSAGTSPRMVQREQVVAAAASAGNLPPALQQEQAGTAGEEAALLRVLSDPALVPLAEACSAAGAECRLLFGGGAVQQAAHGSQQAVLLERWLGRALPLLEAPPAGGAVVLAAAPGCEPEAALACVASLMERRSLGLYQAMVAASELALDLHLGPQHLAALQRWAHATGRH